MKFLVRRNHMKVKGDISIRSLVRIIRRGFEMLSHIEWVSAYGCHLSTAGVVGVAGLLFALRDGRFGNLSNLLLVSDKDTLSEQLRFVPGLRNLGNNCFLNVILQSLASCSSFRSYLVEVKKLQLMTSDDQVDDMPLLMYLTTLLEELGSLQGRSRNLNPRKVMTVMQDYIPQFQLTNQQDSDEALLHLLSCLREELSDSFTPNYGSLADVEGPTSRIFALNTINNLSELRRWRKQYLGPFDGILSSFLTCRTCSSEIMMDFDSFHSLPLSLMFNNRASTLSRLTLEDCIKTFLSPELLEDYFCSHCWHIAASKYLTSIDGKQEEISKLRCCVKQDCCDCKKTPSLRALPWLNRYSHTFKQLYIAQFPQILCLHLKRTSINAFGELVKFQGHISFPMILDLSPFVKHDFGVKKQNVNESKILGKQLYPSSISIPHVIDMCLNPMTTGKVKDEAPKSSAQQCSQRIGNCFNNCCIPIEIDKVAYDALPSKTRLYRLVSVVEHFGRAGSGHYTVYRGARPQIEDDDVDGGVDELPLQWFCISDSDVRHASEEDVLGADASLLFYERI